MNKSARFISVFLFAAIFSSCGKTDIVNVSYDLGKFENRVINADLTNALSIGIEIPTKRQISSGDFKIKFQFSGIKSKKYFYKIYYQNESYKFPENLDTTKQYNPLASENFYGSWEDTTVGFKPISNIDSIITDAIKIEGNPRNEKKYFGEAFENTFYSEENIRNQANAIKADPKWYAAIVSKAKANRVSDEDQLVQDAKWILKNGNGKKTINNRWKRNPRMGIYSLMIVVTTEEDLKQIPSYVQHIDQTAENGAFVSPYYFFSNKANMDLLKHTEVFLDANFLTVKASLNLASGIYSNALEYSGPGKIPVTGSCGWNKDLYLKAQFSQFFSTVQKDFHLNTIPLIEDVNDLNYTQEEYDQALKKYPEDSLKKDYIRNTENPCMGTRYNEVAKAIEIINPGNIGLAEAHKSNMGIKTRVGFTYGKITAKIKFPELINKYGVWNGLTDAFWLLFQSEEEWNNRRPCKTGYTPKGDNRNEAPRSPQSQYSEIDFEMVKTSRYWPADYYKKNWNPHTEDARRTKDIIVGCTNWDMTCKDCRWYTIGIDTIEYGDKKFETMRWDNGYQALTTRTAEKDDELFKRPYYYYQFEWAPDHITWRIGPERDNLHVVGHMNKDITSIPNNQMIAVITQEYHLSEWWPPIPFKQEYIPFPKNEIKGEVYEIIIE